jgi:5-formyltetrahydrofolate cyclo-ligase
VAQLHAKGIRPTLVGVAFSAQEVADIPAEPHDMRMDIIVTERETLVFRKG